MSRKPWDLGPETHCLTSISSKVLSPYITCNSAPKPNIQKEPGTCARCSKPDLPLELFPYVLYRPPNSPRRKGETPFKSTDVQNHPKYVPHLVHVLTYLNWGELFVDASDASADKPGRPGRCGSEALWCKVEFCVEVEEGREMGSIVGSDWRPSS
ncbi:hypothetical protein V8E51_010450 [Hyaloscypha variabilis]